MSSSGVLSTELRLGLLRKKKKKWDMVKNPVPPPTIQAKIFPGQYRFLRNACDFYNYGK